MAKKGTSKALTLDFHDIDRMKKRFEKMGLNIKPAVNEALIKSHDYVTENLHKHMQKPFLPAHGIYSHGDTEKTIVEDKTVYWIGTEAYIGVGFDISKSMTSIYLMYGTQKMAPNEEIYKDVWGRSTRKKIRELQENTMFNYLNTH